jgi:hypothetical protein
VFRVGINIGDIIIDANRLGRFQIARNRFNPSRRRIRLTVRRDADLGCDLLARCHPAYKICKR